MTRSLLADSETDLKDLERLVFKNYEHLLGKVAKNSLKQKKTC